MPLPKGIDSIAAYLRVWCPADIGTHLDMIDHAPQTSKVRPTCEGPRHQNCGSLSKRIVHSELAAVLFLRMWIDVPPSKLKRTSSMSWLTRKMPLPCSASRF